MSYILLNGKKREIISEKLVTGYLQESNLEVRKRNRKGLPPPKYQYMAIKVK